MATVTLGWGLRVVGGHLLVATLTGLVEDAHGFAIFGRHIGIALVVAGLTPFILLSFFVRDLLAAFYSMMAVTTLKALGLMGMVVKGHGSFSVLQLKDRRAFSGNGQARQGQTQATDQSHNPYM